MVEGMQNGPTCAELLRVVNNKMAIPVGQAEGIGTCFRTAQWSCQ